MRRVFVEIRCDLVRFQQIYIQMVLLYLIFDTTISEVSRPPEVRVFKWRRGTRGSLPPVGWPWQSLDAYFNVCTVGGAATPTALNARPALPVSSLRKRNRLPCCSTSTYCTRSKS